MLLLTLAKRFLLSNEKKSFRAGVIAIATFGVFFACCAVTVTLGILSGYQKVHRDAVLNFGTHLVVFNQNGILANDQQTLSTFLSESPIKNNFSRYHLFEALAPTTKGLRPIIFKGIDMKELGSVYRVKLEGAVASNTSVIVGKALLGLQREATDNQRFKYLTLKDKKGQRQTRFDNVNVSGTFESGFWDFDSRFVLMPLDLLHELFFAEPIVSGFEIRLNDPNLVGPLKDLIVERFGHEFDVITWDELNASLFESLKLERTVVVSVAFLVLMIACLNIFGFNFLFFIERKREFLILAALGFGLKRLRQLLALLSFLLGGVASVVGMVCGLGLLILLQRGRGVPLDPEVYFIDRIPVHFEPVWFGAALLGSIVLCLITSWLAGKVVVKRWPLL